MEQDKKINPLQGEPFSGEGGTLLAGADYERFLHGVIKLYGLDHVTKVGAAAEEGEGAWQLLMLDGGVFIPGARFMLVDGGFQMLNGYGRELNLQDVYQFASQNPNRYEKMQEWGMFRSISQKMAKAVEGSGLSLMGTAMRANSETEIKDGSCPWKIQYVLMFAVGNGSATAVLEIPADGKTADEADGWFLKAWEEYMKGYDAVADAARMSGRWQGEAADRAKEFVAAKKAALEEISRRLEEAR